MSERSDAKAHGYYKDLTEWDSILTLEVLAEVLPVLATLSKSLQAENLDFVTVDIRVQSTIRYVKQLLKSRVAFSTIWERAIAVFKSMEATKVVELPKEETAALRE